MPKETGMDDITLQNAISNLELVNHRLHQFEDMIRPEDNEKKYLEETRQMVKNIINDLMGEEILKEIQGHVDKERNA
jgi:hypothetical protein